MGSRVERGLTPGPGNRAKCLSVFMLLGKSWLWVRPALPSSFLTCRLRAIVRLRVALGTVR